MIYLENITNCEQQNMGFTFTKTDKSNYYLREGERKWYKKAKFKITDI